MTITSALVLYAVFWFMTLFVVLPIGLRTQGDEGKIVPGTHAGSPADLKMKPIAWRVTWIAAILWAVTSAVILSGWISPRDIDWFDRMDPPLTSPAAPADDRDG